MRPPEASCSSIHIVDSRSTSGALVIDQHHKRHMVLCFSCLISSYLRTLPQHAACGCISSVLKPVQNQLPAPVSQLPASHFKSVLHVLQIKHRRLVRSDRAVPSAYQQLVAQRADLYRQLQELQSQVSVTRYLPAPVLEHPPYLKSAVALYMVPSFQQFLEQHSVASLARNTIPCVSGKKYHTMCVKACSVVQGNVVWKMEVPEELLSPRSRLAASVAGRLAQGVAKGVLNLGGILGSFGNFLAGKLSCIICCLHLPAR